MNAALKWKLIAGFLLVFVAGGVTGGFLAASTMRHYFLSGRHHSIAAQHMRERLKAQLNLTPEQMAKISPVIDKTAAQLEDIRKDTARRVHDTFSNAHEQIAADLNPEQRAKLEQLRQRHHRLRARFHRKQGGIPASPSVSASPSP
jgi:Spy/CpxP family protein refolding chaperone